MSLILMRKGLNNEFVPLDMRFVGFEFQQIILPNVSKIT